MSGTDTRSGIPVRLFDEDNLPYTENNPLPVNIAESEGDEIQNFKQDDDVDKVAGPVVTSVNHDYTVSVGKTFLLSSVLFAAAGRAKFEVQVETGVGAGTFVTKGVGFTSTSKGNGEVNFSREVKIVAGVKIRVIKSNLDNTDQNLYSTIVGLEK